MESPILAVEQISKSFGELRAVDRLSFQVRPGETFGFLGPNGAGKTTTLRMIMGITRPDSGTIRHDGGPALDRRRTGYLPEDRGLFEDATVVDTLVYLGSLRRMRRADARAEGLRWLARLDLADRAQEKVGALSKGNQQKVQFAAAVLHRPRLAVLDEPFAGLDPLNQELFLGFIRELRNDGTAVLLSAHHLDLVERLCDRFLLISRGAAVLAGTLDEMRRAVLGDASEVLTVVLREHGSAGATASALDAWAAAEAPGSRTTRRAAADGRLEMEILLRADRDLSALIGGVARRFPLERVHMRALSLHEIYLRAVGERDGGRPPTGESE